MIPVLFPHNPHLLLDTSTDLWFYQGEYNESNGLTPKTKFSIIIPFRDENENLPLLLDSFRG
jgi:hypothetical protein